MQTCGGYRSYIEHVKGQWFWGRALFFRPFTNDSSSIHPQKDIRTASGFHSIAHLSKADLCTKCKNGQCLDAVPWDVGEELEGDHIWQGSQKRLARGKKPDRSLIWESLETMSPTSLNGLIYIPNDQICGTIDTPPSSMLAIAVW